MTEERLGHRYVLAMENPLADENGVSWMMYFAPAAKTEVPMASGRVTFLRWPEYYDEMVLYFEMRGWTRTKRIGWSWRYTVDKHFGWVEASTLVPDVLEFLRLRLNEDRIRNYEDVDRWLTLAGDLGTWYRICTVGPHPSGLDQLLSKR